MALVEDSANNPARVWLVRGGRDGAQEPIALERGRAVVGWDQIGDLSETRGPEDIRALLDASVREYPSRGAQTRDVNALFGFAHEMASGDFVLMPLMTRPGTVAVGEVAGPYEYRPDFPASARHTRPVRWLKSDVPRDWFPGLETTLAFRGTIRRVPDGDAHETVEAALDGTPRRLARRAAWLFQTNPRYSDFARELDELDEVKFVVAQYSTQIRTGDSVYLWESGANAGVIALGTILSDPELMTDDEGAPYVLEAERFEGEKLRVRIAVDEVLERRVPREALKAHPVLRDLGVITFPNASNFEVTAEQDQALRALIQASAQGAAVWWVCQGNSYRQERDLNSLWGPKRAKDGSTRAFWQSLTEARPGDVVLHYATGQVRAVSTVQERAIDSAEPPELEGAYTGSPGWLVRSNYRELAEPIPLTDIPVEWRIAHGAPFTTQGSVQQGYFYRLSDDFVTNLVSRFPRLGLPGDAPPGDDYEEPPFSEIEAAVEAAEMRIDPRTLRRLHVSLRTRGFVILSGVSGTGKTWLSELYASAVGAAHLLVPVAPNWTTNEDLLGYLNPLDSSYQDTPFSVFLREAAAEFEAAAAAGRRARPYHLLLDEMNLARVEYYFAKFLSAMEVRSRNETATLELAPGHEVLLTPNLFFIGTVNVDETTHGFADKVYDRAQLLELRVDRDHLVAHLEGLPYRDDLVAVWDAVSEVAPFAFRVLDDIRAYVTESEALGASWEEALDEQLLQKVLPKLKGADLRVQSALDRLVELADGRFPLSGAKAAAMVNVYREHGFTSYF